MILALLGLFSLPAVAQQSFNFPIVCFEGDELIKQLEKDFSETAVAQGLDGRGFLWQIYRADETFTVVFIDPQRNLSCMVGGGQVWQPVGDSY